MFFCPAFSNAWHSRTSSAFTFPFTRIQGNGLRTGTGRLILLHPENTGGTAPPCSLRSHRLCVVTDHSSQGPIPQGHEALQHLTWWFSYVWYRLNDNFNVIFSDFNSLKIVKPSEIYGTYRAIFSYSKFRSAIFWTPLIKEVIDLSSIFRVQSNSNACMLLNVKFTSRRKGLFS